jgi:hypothetical protein
VALALRFLGSNPHVATRAARRCLGKTWEGAASSFPTFPFHRTTLPQQFVGEIARSFRQILSTFHMRSTSASSEPMAEVISATEIEDDHRQADGLEVFLWRFQRSLAMGFGRRLADRIAVSRIDLHELEHLLAWGCPRRTAYRILRP